jgi:hypothetical protein
MGERVFHRKDRRFASLVFVVLFCMSTMSLVINADQTQGDGGRALVVIAGTAYQDEGITILSGAAITLVVNGVLMDMAMTDPGGNFLFNADLYPGDGVLLYIDNSAYKGNTVFVADGTDAIGVEIYGDQTLIVGSQTGSIGNSDIVNALGAHSDPDILFSFVGNDIILVAGASLLTNNMMTYLASGSISATGFIQFGSSVVLTGDITLTASEVTFNGDVNSDALPHSLAVDGNCNVNGNIGSVFPLADFLVGATGLTNIKGDIYTTGLQSFGGSVILGDDCWFAAEGGITFQGTLNDDGGQYDLFLNAADNADIHFQGDVGTIKSPAYVRIVSAHHVIAQTLTSYYFVQDSGTGTTSFNSLSANLAMITTHNVQGQLTVDQLFLNTYTAMLYGYINGDSGPVGASAIGIMNLPIFPGTHYFNSIDLFMTPPNSAPPTNPSYCYDTDGVVSDQWTTDGDPWFWWGGANHSAFPGKGFYYYWGTSPAGTSTSFTLSTSFDPPALTGNQTRYLRVQAWDFTGQRAAWETIFVYKYDGTTTVDIPLDLGWNLVSLPLVQSDNSLDKVLASIAGKWDCVQAYASLASESWKSNITTRPTALNNLDSLDRLSGFWINVVEAGVILHVTGEVPGSTMIPLYAGWNLVGYPTLNDTMTVGNALWGTGADRVEVCDALDPYRLREVGSTYIMKPGEGYWVHVVADTNWVVDW